MGLLDDVLGSLAGQAMGAGSTRQPTQASAGGPDMTKLLVTLLPVVLAMLSNRGAQRGAPSQSGFGPSASASGGGGLGDILGQVLGGAMGGGGTGGGLGGLLEQMQRAGFGTEADSWVGTGQNRPLPPDAMGKVFGREGVQEIARRTGYDESDVSRGLSQLLPEVVNHVTPNGQVPDLDALSASVGDLARRLGSR